MSGKVTCRQCADFLVEYLDGELEAEVRATFEWHLERCRNCRNYLEQYSAVITAGKKACQREEAEATDSFPEELVKAILDAQRGRSD